MACSEADVTPASGRARSVRPLASFVAAMALFSWLVEDQRAVAGSIPAEQLFSVVGDFPLGAP